MENILDEIKKLQEALKENQYDIYKLQNDNKCISNKISELKEKFCDEWFKSNVNNYFKLKINKETFYEHYITSIYQFSNKAGYRLRGCKVEIIDESVIQIQNEISTEYLLSDFYELINNVHTDKLSQITVDDITKVIRKFENRIVDKK